jgi:enolase
MARIEKIWAREVLDSRGNSTVEAEAFAGDASARAIVPAGASTGSAEAHELRDGDSSRYDGRGVLQAVDNIRSVIAPALSGYDPLDQQAIDRRILELDGTPQKTRLGGNALLAVSLATAHLAARVRGVPLWRHLNDLLHQVDPGAPAPRIPPPMINMISGGLHAGGNLDFHDFMILPVGAADYATGLEWTVRVYRRLGELLRAAGYEGHLVGDEGGYGPKLPSNLAAAEFVVRAIEHAALTPSRDVQLALDVAATHFYDGSHYRPSMSGDGRLTAAQMIDQLAAMVDRFPIASMEDPLAEDDWSGWQAITARLGQRVRLVGDDLFATNPQRLRRGIASQAANSVLIKLNQIGTLSETLETIALARGGGYGYVVSARSGESEDTTIADLAVATAADSIKIGSVARSERLAKYNRLLRIVEEL